MVLCCFLCLGPYLTEVSKSLVLDTIHKHSVYLGSLIPGASAKQPTEAKMAPNTCTSNTKLDYLDLEDLDSFIKHELDIDIQDGQYCSSDQTPNAKLKLLNMMTLRMVEKLPWENLTYVLRQAERYTSVEECVQSGEGGQCGTLAFLLKQLLVAAGFHASLGLFNPKAIGVESHMVIVIRDVVSAGDIYLVNLGGMRFPPHAPILLNTQDGGSSDVYKNCFYQGRYVRRGEVYIHQMKAVDNKHHHTYSDEWQDEASFHLRATSDEQAFALLNAVDLSGPLTKTLDALMLRNGKVIMLFRNKLSIEDDSGEITDRELESGADIIQAFLTHFPMIKKDTVQQAVKLWCAQNSFPLNETGNSTPTSRL